MDKIDWKGRLDEHVDNLIMNKEAINKMIERQGVYEIEYKKDVEVKNQHISNIEFSPEHGDSYIFAYCHEAGKELTFNIGKLISLQEYWIGILSKDAVAPKDGMYLVASTYLGQGIDIEYALLVLKKGDSFVGREDSCSKPIAFHFIPNFGMPEGKWIKKEITIKKWKDEKIPMKGIPIIAYSSRQKEECCDNPASIKYCIGNGGGQHGIEKNSDITTYFKEWDNYEPFGWSECWDGYRILGFVIINEYDIFACRHHIEQRLKVEPNFLFY